MTEAGTGTSPDLVSMTTEIVANYVAGNRVPVEELTSVIRSVHTALSAAASGQSDSSKGPEVTRATSAQVRKSITEGGLISFEDGRTYQTLKRHLTGRGLSLAQYREKWGLPADYPATAPAYAAKRSALAKAIGLGSKGKSAGASAKTAAAGKTDSANKPTASGNKKPAKKA